MQKRFGIITAAVIAAALALSGCGLGNDDSSSASASCEKGDLATITEGKLTIATGEPAYLDVDLKHWHCCCKKC